ncbi:MAG TPA: SIS domain-containing protein [Terriglobales bacterium]|nr:SIS domain-containing protein [Terriglobales bacterium]
MNPTQISTEPGSHTLSEILSQPQTWRQCLARLASSSELLSAARMSRPGAEWTFIGCGTSYYLAISAAAAFIALGLPARAIPASEVLLYPSLALIPGRDFIPVVISRSGRTSEAVRAARQLEEQHDVRTIAITCADGQPLEAECSLTLKLLGADEQSMVMTRSFTTMLLSLQYLAATILGNAGFQRFLTELPMQAAALFESVPQRLHEFVGARTFDDCVFLAQGPLFGIASECMLKVTEASCTYAQVFHSLEFRHGPKSIVSPDTLLTFLLSESSYEAEVELLEEMKNLGAATMVIANRLDDRARALADFAVELNLAVPELVRPAVFTPWGQLYGVYTGLKKGLNPDAPKNLSRVVVLD